MSTGLVASNRFVCWTNIANEVVAQRSDLFPLRDSIFEGRPVKIPYNYAGLLQDEYSKASLTRTKYSGRVTTSFGDN